MSVYVGEYGPNAIFIGSDKAEGTRPYRDIIKNNGGSWNPALVDPLSNTKGVWIFSAKQLTNVENLVNDINAGKYTSSPQTPVRSSVQLKIPVKSPSSQPLKLAYAKPQPQEPVQSKAVRQVPNGYQLYCFQILKPVEGETLNLESGSDSWEGVVSNLKYDDFDSVESFNLVIGDTTYTAVIKDKAWKIRGLDDVHSIVRKLK